MESRSSAYARSPYERSGSPAKPSGRHLPAFGVVVLGLLIAALPAGLSASEPDKEAWVRGGLGNEVGFHFGSPLKLSCHASTIVPLGEGTFEERAGIFRKRGLELLVEAGLGGARAGVGWGVRGVPYLHGWSAGLGVVCTWESLDDPLAYPANHSMGSLSARMVTLGATVRGEVLYDLDAPGDRWGVGWSIGFVIW